MPTQSSHTETHPNDSKTCCQEPILQDVHTHKNIIQSLFVKPTIIWGFSRCLHVCPIFAPCVLTSMLRIVPWHHFTRQLCDLCKRIHCCAVLSGQRRNTKKKGSIVRTSGWKFSSRGRTRCVRQLTCTQKGSGFWMWTHRQLHRFHQLSIAQDGLIRIGLSLPIRRNKTHQDHIKILVAYATLIILGICKCVPDPLKRLLELPTWMWIRQLVSQTCEAFLKHCHGHHVWGLWNQLIIIKQYWT